MILTYTVRIATLQCGFFFCEKTKTGAFQMSLSAFIILDRRDREIEMVKINGEMTDAAGAVLEDILVEKGFNMKLIAVEINEHIVKKADYPETILQDGDTVEVVSFVSGG